MADTVKQTRRTLPIKRKYQAFQDILSGISKKFVAEKYEVPRNTRANTWHQPGFQTGKKS